MMNHRLLLVLCLLVFVSRLSGQALIPVPWQMNPVKNGGEFVITPDTRVVYADDVLRGEAEELCAVIGKRTGVELVAEQGTGIVKKAFNLLISPAIAGKQSYDLTVTDKSVVISASAPAGIFYGIKTLEQLLLRRGELRAVRIIDKPRFEYRALMLDPARTFIPVADVKRYIDQMARYKFNVLHLHLTDDQGWRIEIKKYPLLTEIGSVRRETDGDGRPHRGFYTQEQMRELIAYAADRHVEIVPEIDVPGHSVAAIAAYPWLTCQNRRIEVRTTAGVSKDLLCAGNERVYGFYADILTELCALFPSPKFHLGGDEAPLDNWKKCPRCKALMKSEGYSDERMLMSYFLGRMNEVLQKNGKTPLFWYELDVPEYPANTITYAWRWGLSQEVIEKARGKGYRVICAPGEYAYFDYPQFPGDMPEVNWGMPVTPLRKVYEFDPGYGLPADRQAHIMGVEATLWGECIPDIDRAFYMTYPRALAFAEAGWSMMENRDWESFRRRMYPHLESMMREGINFRVPFEITK